MRSGSFAVTALPDLHPTVDDQVDPRNVGALVGDQVKRGVGDVLGLAKTAEEGPRFHLAPELGVIEFALVELVSMNPGETELTRMPCSLPSMASWRVIPMSADLLVVCANDGSNLKLSDPLREAMFKTTPWVALGWPRCAGEVVHQVDLVASGRPQSSSLKSSSLLKWERCQVVQHVDTPEAAERQLDEPVALRGITDSARLQRHHLSARSFDHVERLLGGLDGHVAADNQAPSRAKVKAVARPMLPPVPVMTQTFPASRPAISLMTIGCRGLLFRVCHTHSVGVLGTSRKYQWMTSRAGPASGPAQSRKSSVTTASAVVGTAPA